MKNLIIFLAWALPFGVLGQKFSSAEMQKVRNKDRISYYYKDSLLGCSYDLNCSGFDISFSDIYYDRKSRRLSVSGNVFWTTETRPLPNVSIFVAKPAGKKITRRKNLYVTKKKPGIEEYPYEMGAFKFRFKVKKSCNLFFAHPSFLLVEYDVSKLVNPSQ